MKEIFFASPFRIVAFRSLWSQSFDKSLQEKKITVIGLFFSFFSVKSSPSAINIFSILVFIFVFIYLYQKLTNIFPNKSILPSSNVYGYDYY